MGAAKYKNVMLVDDSETDCFTTNNIIVKNNFADNISTFLTGKSALEFLKNNENNPDELPNIILLDIIMPIMNGFDFLKEFAKMNDTIHKQCKVVLLSATGHIEDLNLANKNKFVSKFIMKPLTKEALDAINF